LDKLGDPIMTSPNQYPRVPVRGFHMDEQYLNEKYTALNERFIEPSTIGDTNVFNIHNNTGNSITIESNSMSLVIKTFIMPTIKSDEVVKLYIPNQLGAVMLVGTPLYTVGSGELKVQYYNMGNTTSINAGDVMLLATIEKCLPSE
jgi:hypothetical protein